MDNYDVGPDKAQWPNNIISRQAVVYANGVIAHRDMRIKHSFDPDELALCKRLALNSCSIMLRVDVGMGSSSSDPFRNFFITANIDDHVPKCIDEDFIRLKFCGTLFPPVTITVEPLAEKGIWWSEVLHDAGDYKGAARERYLRPWREMIEWFNAQAELTSPVFVRIGDSESLFKVQPEEYPEGTVTTGCVLPRLAVGLSSHGSLIGLFGYSVQA